MLNRMKVDLLIFFFVISLEGVKLMNSTQHCLGPVNETELNVSSMVSGPMSPYMNFYPALSNDSSGTPAAPERQCTAPSGVIGEMEEGLEKRSLCPWTWRMNVDGKRIPAVMMEAHCQCDKLRLRYGQGGPVVEYECEQLKYRVRVVKYEEDQCRGKSQEGYEDVAVACVPVRQAIKMVNDRQSPIRQRIENWVHRDY